MSEAIFWGGLVYALGFGLFVKRRRVLDTPTAKTVSAAIGRAELCGSAHGDPAQTSLVTETPCAYWEAELHRRVPNGKGGKTMKRIAMANARIGHFWIADQSGRMPVLVDGAQWWFDGATTLRSRGWRRSTRCGPSPPPSSISIVRTRATSTWASTCSTACSRAA